MQTALQHNTFCRIHLDHSCPSRTIGNTPYWYWCNWSARNALMVLAWDTRPTNVREISLKIPHVSLPTAAIMAPSPAGVRTVQCDAKSVAETRQRPDDASKSTPVHPHRLDCCSHWGLRACREIRRVGISRLPDHYSALLRNVCLEHTQHRALSSSQTTSS